MREILFKAKRKNWSEHPKVLWWVEGYLLIDGVTGQYFIQPAGCCLNESDKVGQEGHLRLYAYEVDPETVCQYTVVTDKNNNRIWEKDIVKRKGMSGEEITGIVVWRDIGFTGFFLEVKAGDMTQYYPIGCGQYDDDESEICSDVVIGNIFDNPELIKEVEQNATTER